MSRTLKRFGSGEHIRGGAGWRRRRPGPGDAGSGGRVDATRVMKATFPALTKVEGDLTPAQGGCGGLTQASLGDAMAALEAGGRVAPAAPTHLAAGQAGPGREAHPGERRRARLLSLRDTHSAAPPRYLAAPLSTPGRASLPGVPLWPRSILETSTPRPACVAHDLSGQPLLDRLPCPWPAQAGTARSGSRPAHGSGTPRVRHPRTAPSTSPRVRPSSHADKDTPPAEHC